MKNLNIHFVGYFLDKVDKIQFTHLFNCKEKFYLEASAMEYLHKKKNTAYYPELLQHIVGEKKYKTLTQKIEVTSLTKKLYKHELKYYKGSTTKKIKFSENKISLYLFVYTFIEFKKQNNGISQFNLIALLRNFLKRKAQYNKKNPKATEELLRFIFRLEFLTGYLHAKQLLDHRTYTKDDVYILWGKSYSSRLLLIDILEKNKVPYFVAEYGEVPGTISLSHDGIFGEIFSPKKWDTLSQKEITHDDTLNAKNILDTIKTNKVSTRNYGNNMYFLMKYFYDNSVKKENKQKIVYVNGAELFSSGLYYNRWNINNNRVNPNKMLLTKVVSFFREKDYLIIYKEHPMTVKQSKKSMLNPSDFPTVDFIKSMDIHDILELADLIVTFPSKVVITSLLYKKDTFVLGDFTIPKSIPSIGYYTSRDFNNISNIFSQEVSKNTENFEKLIARLIKYSLIVFDKTLHHNFNCKYEQEKLDNILETRKNQY